MKYRIITPDMADIEATIVVEGEFGLVGAALVGIGIIRCRGHGSGSPDIDTDFLGVQAYANVAFRYPLLGLTERQAVALLTPNEAKAVAECLAKHLWEHAQSELDQGIAQLHAIDPMPEGWDRIEVGLVKTVKLDGTAVYQAHIAPDPEGGVALVHTILGNDARSAPSKTAAFGAAVLGHQPFPDGASAMAGWEGSFRASVLAPLVGVVHP